MASSDFFWSERREAKGHSPLPRRVQLLRWKKQISWQHPHPRPPTGCLSLFPGSVLPRLNYIYEIYRVMDPHTQKTRGPRTYTHKKWEDEGNKRSRRGPRWGLGDVKWGSPRRHYRRTTTKDPERREKKITNNMALGWELLEGNNQSSELIALMTRSPVSALNQFLCQLPLQKGKNILWPSLGRVAMTSNTLFGNVDENTHLFSFRIRTTSAPPNIYLMEI